MLWRDLWLNEWAPEFDNSKSANNHRHGKIWVQFHNASYICIHLAGFDTPCIKVLVIFYASSWRQECSTLFTFFPTCTNHGIHDFTFETRLICFVYLFDLYTVLFNGILPEFSILRSHFADAFKRCDVFEMHIFLLERFICF